MTTRFRTWALGAGLTLALLAGSRAADAQGTPDLPRPPVIRGTPTPAAAAAAAAAALAAKQPTDHEPAHAATDASGASGAAAANAAAERATIWPPEEIAAARARCDVLLKPHQVVFEVEEPYRDGECGTPAPVKLSKINGVALSPPSSLTCEMVAALGSWIKSDLQPLARKTLGAPVTSLNIMSSYSCRAAYGRVGGKLSEHGKANALDIGGFVTAKGETASVLTAWGPTAREVRAEVAKAEADRKKAEDLVIKQAHQRALDEAKAAKAAMAQQKVAPAADPGPAYAPAHAATLPLPPSKDRAPALGYSPPNHLGGPKEQDGTGKAAVPAAKPAPGVPRGPAPVAKQSAPASDPLVDTMEIEVRRMQFLREAHASACKTFGTVLGPEANSDHRNHFHLDMAERKMARSICE